MLQMMISGHGPRGYEVVKGKTIKGLEGTPWTLHSLINHFG